VVTDGDHAAPADEPVPPVEAAAVFPLALQESRRRVGQTGQPTVATSRIVLAADDLVTQALRRSHQRRRGEVGRWLSGL
jgi:hypothetical protein